MLMTVEVEREEDGRWIAEVADLAGVMTYGATRDEAIARAEALALRVLADRLEHGEAGPDLVSVSFRAAQPDNDMGSGPAAQARRVLAALVRIGWVVKRETGSHKILARDGFSDYVFAFHDSDELGPRILARMARRTGLRPEDL